MARLTGQVWQHPYPLREGGPGSALQQPVDRRLHLRRVLVPVPVHLPTGPAGSMAVGPAPPGYGVVRFSQTDVVASVNCVSSSPPWQAGRHNGSDGLEGPCDLYSHFELQRGNIFSVDHDVVAVRAQVGLAKECPHGVQHRLPSRRELLPALRHPARDRRRAGRHGHDLYVVMSHPGIDLRIPDFAPGAWIRILRHSKGAGDVLAGDFSVHRRPVGGAQLGAIIRLMANDWDRLRSALIEAHVSGTEDVGRFVGRTQYFRPSRFDERRAMPILLRLLPTLTDRNAVTAVAGHLRRPWARPIAFPGLLEAFKAWASKDELVCWELGDALAATAEKEHVEILIDLVQQREYGKSRAMLVYSLWRFRKSGLVDQTLLRLIEDPDVAAEAMTALRRTLGNDAALPHLRRIRDSHPDDTVRRKAAREAKRAEAASHR